MRYSFNRDIEFQDGMSFDVVIIGAGLAGIYTALNIDPRFTCAVLTKEGLDISNSWLAQGGIAAAISKDDKPLFHLEDTLIAGAGLCDEEAVRILVDEGPEEIRNLVSLNVPFDLNEDGDLQITREGGHRRNRIVHAGGDATGRETVKTLAALAHSRPNIYFFPYTFFIDILTDKNTGAVTGAVTRDFFGSFGLISTKNIVICAGGIGQVYMKSTNPLVATGDGIAAAMRAGARLRNMEFIQFHPTGLYSDTPERRAFLISEAVRGEGGILRNAEGVRFMENAHELKELAPRDIVARAIFREMERTGTTHVFLDITDKSEKFLSERFPTIYNECLNRGINISRDFIPVCPVQHYLIGGIETDLNGMTNVPGLYACGESAYTGVHGANRLASNSMLECLVFGRRAARHIVNEGGLEGDEQMKIDPLPDLRPYRDVDTAELRVRIQHTMNEYGYVIRNREGLETALSIIDEILETLEGVYMDDKDYFETLNVAMVAKSILEAAIGREKSVGAHYRED